jgi:hypothetical protein
VPAVPTAAPLTRDLTIDGFGLAAVGVIGLVASLIVVGGNPTRVVVPWVIVLLVLGLAQVVVGGGWLRNAIQDAPDAPDDLVTEAPGIQTRRAATPTIVAAVLLLLALLVVPPFAPIVAGLAAGAAATDLRSRQWISADERVQGVTILRETTPLPFATSRKRLWVRPSA